MQIKKSHSSSSELPPKQNQYLFNIDNERTFALSSNFESGNINLVKQIHQLYYILEAVNDADAAPNKKTWFYFKMRSQRGIKVRLIIQNVNIYETAFQQKQLCKPFFRQGQTGKWQSLTDSFLTYRDEIALVIDHSFKNSQYIYVCLTVPFTYSDNQNYLISIQQHLHPNITYQDQILSVTPQGRSVHLLTITEKSNKTTSKSSSHLQDRKPVILLTARVHPGEVSSSYCMQGMLQFLLSYNNLQAYLLRRLFIFKIVPMLNPDGVYEGNYRMDPQGRNLNRFYLDPSKQQHHAIYQITQLMKTTTLKQKIQFYFDLHSHSSIKEAFIYGNALDDIVQQTYSELFCRILQENYPRFRYSLSNFDQKQMKHKDRGQPMSKEGCGRVVINKVCGVIQSYTVQSSIFSSAYECSTNKPLKLQPSNKEFVHSSQNGQSSYEYEQIYDQYGEQSLLVSQNKRLGKSIMVSILDMIRKNPYSRFSQQTIDSISKEICIKLLQSEERFKLMDTKAYHKSKMIHSYISTSIEHKTDTQWNICGIHSEFNAVAWPKEIRKITVFQPSNSRDKGRSHVKSLRVKTEGREKTTSQSLSKAKKQLKPQTKIQNPSSHRSNSPIEQNPQKSLLPQIKYSVQLKPSRQRQAFQKTKRPIVKQIQFSAIQNSTNVVEGQKVKKKMIIDYIQQEISKIVPDKQIFKRSNNASLNRLIANKIMEKEKEKEKAKTRNGQINQYQKIIVESRKKIVTEGKHHQEISDGKTAKDRALADNEEQTTMKGLQLRKADLMKKRFLMTNKAIELIRNNERVKSKLSETNKLNLIISNAKKQCLSNHEQMAESRY